MFKNGALIKKQFGLERKDISAGRYDNIDLIEFLAMLFVMIYHTTTVQWNILADASVWTYINYIVRPILATCVPLFFFANGFLLINKKFDLKKHIIKMIRLIILTFIWGAIDLLLLMPIEGQWFTLREFVDALWSWKQGWINHLWYMGALICVYIFFPLIKLTFDYNKKIFNYWLVVSILLSIGNSAIAMGLTFANYILRDGSTVFDYNFFNMFNPFASMYGFSFAFMSLGCFIGGNKEKIHEIIKKIPYINTFSLAAIILISTLMLGAWGILVAKLTGYLPDMVWDGYGTIFTAINVLGIYFISSNYKYKGNIVNRYIRNISQNTLGIYYFHVVFLHLFSKYLLPLIPHVDNYLFNILYAFCVMTLCLFISMLIKSIPVVKKLLM
ncbi:MAG: acyltransferase family protein [Clostridia bacterium]|nr:acyltransferase family protein [Clostridia bacterium]